MRKPYPFIVAFQSATILILLTGILSTPRIRAQETTEEPHPTNTGTVMRFPMEASRSGSSHTEGILGRCFPNIHGGDALHFDYVYTGAVFNNARGGERTKGATSYNGVFELGITADTEKFGLWKNGTFYMHSFFTQGLNPSRYIGDYQEVSVIAYETPAQVSEYWYEHRLFRDRLKIKAGKQDAGVDFFYLDSTADFLNASATFVPLNPAPTAPNNAWGVSAYLDLTENLCLKAGFYDGQANANKFWMSESGDIYSAYQVETHYSLFRHLPGFAFLGAWYDNSEVESFETGDTHRSNYGFNVGAEQMIYRRNICDEEDLRGLTVFFQYAETKRDRNELKGFWSLGAKWLGLFEHRPDDIFGLAVYTARFSKGYRAAEELTYGSEYTYEINYKAMLTENVALQPVFQYIVHPGGRHRNAFVPGIVFQLVF